MAFKNSIEPKASQTSNARSLQNTLILRSLLGGASERTLVREERQQRKNSKESHYAAASLMNPIKNLSLLILRFSFISMALCITEVTTYGDGGVPYCDCETVQAALPYAAIVLANGEDDFTQSATPAYEPLATEACPDALKPYMVQNGLKSYSKPLIEETKDLLGGFFHDLDHLFDDEEIVVETYPEETINLHTIEHKGVCARLYKHNENQEMVIAFRGTEDNLFDKSHRFFKNWGDNLMHSLLGEEAGAYKFANDLVKMVKAAYPDHNIICAGISMGGGLAQYAALMNDVDAYCFNGTHLHGDVEVQIHENKIHHIYVHGDLLQYVMTALDGQRLGEICQIEPGSKRDKTSGGFFKKRYQRLTDRLERHSSEFLHDSLIKAAGQCS
jgi:hypothetical protein